MLQCVVADQLSASPHAGTFSALQCVAVCCSVLQGVAVCCRVLQYDAVCCSVLQRVAACCSVLQRLVACRCLRVRLLVLLNALQYVACVAAVLLQCVAAVLLQCVTIETGNWLIHTCDMTHAYDWHVAFTFEI